jgi:hypothetical protein
MRQRQVAGAFHTLPVRAHNAIFAAGRDSEQREASRCGVLKPKKKERDRLKRSRSFAFGK